MSLTFRQEAASPELESALSGLLAAHAQEATGRSGMRGEPVAFIAREGEVFAGAVIARLIWGQLHIKQLAVDPAFRSDGVGGKLMADAHDYGRKAGASFAFVETFSYQAEEFYKKLGYVRDFARAGYADNVSFIYMTKRLTP